MDNDRGVDESRLGVGGGRVERRTAGPGWSHSQLSKTAPVMPVMPIVMFFHLVISTAVQDDGSRRACEG